MNEDDTDGDFFLDFFFYIVVPCLLLLMLCALASGCARPSSPAPPSYEQLQLPNGGEL